MYNVFQYWKNENLFSPAKTVQWYVELLTRDLDSTNEANVRGKFFNLKYIWHKKYSVFSDYVERKV